MGSWYYAVEDERKGPVSDEALRALVERGVVSQATLVWTDGFPEWVEAATVEGLFAGPPPLPKRRSSPPAIQAVSEPAAPKTYDIILPTDVLNSLPTVVRNTIAKQPPDKQSVFLEEFRRRGKSTGTAYLLWLLDFHYIYVDQLGINVLLWLSYLCYGVGFIWWFVDLFRVGGMVARYNSNVAVAVAKDLGFIRHD